MKIRSLSREASFLPQSIDRERRTVEVVWSTGARVLRSDFMSGPHYEELSLDPKHVDLRRFNSGAPVVDNHKTWSLKDQIGVVERAWIDGKEAKALIRFSKRADVQPIFDDIADGVFRNISIGYRVLKADESTRQGDKIKTITATKWEPYELSLVLINADAKAQVRSNKVEPELEENTSIGIPENNQDVKEKEKLRCRSIIDLTRKFSMEQSFADTLIDKDKSLDEAREIILEALSNRSIAQEIRTTSIELGQDERDFKRSGIANALLNRANPVNKLDDNGRRYRSYSLLDVAKECVGASSNTLTKDRLVSRAFHSTSDFPEILGNAAQQSLMASYERLMQKQNFWPLARIKSAPDFRPMRRVRIGEMPSLAELPEGAEYSHGTLGESAEEYRISTWGRSIGITRQMVINDDLGALDTLSNWGGAISRLESFLFWSIFNDNPKMADGIPLFDKKHGNKAENPVELSVEALAAARIAMGRQQGIDKGEGDFLDLKPEFLIVPLELQMKAEQLLSREVLPLDPSKVNPFKDAFTPIVTSRIKDPKAWFLSTSNEQGVDLIEMAYLDGQRAPFIEWETDFKTDSLVVKARMDIAAKAIDYRGFYKGA